ncbi:hypothetical protein FRC11_012735 [Ceratobasidium sp. 423]|nr:hypothetical protein FRC11_012735 [Ceratobasidium sp. 423]
MSIDDTILAYNSIVSSVFSDKKLLSNGHAAYSATKMEEELKKIIQMATGNADERMLEDDPGETRCMVVIYAVFAHNVNASLPCAFRTYPSSAHTMPNCRIWEALRASTAHPRLFKSMEILNRDFGIAQYYIGGGIGYSNPTAHLLKEAAIAFPDRFVASITSIGTGHTDTIRFPVPGPSTHERITPKTILELTHTIAMDNQRVAQEMASYFSGTFGLYYRFDVEQGMQVLEPTELGKQSEITSHTYAYVSSPEVDRRLNSLVKAIRERPKELKTTQITGPSTLPPKSPPTTSSNLPPPTYFFTGRSTEVAMVCRYFGKTDPTQQVFVLHGLGGAGKTQTALKAMDQIASNFEGVLFIDGSSCATIEAAFSELATSKHAGDTYKDALNWLRNREGRWLLLFDNVDDLKIPLPEYFPRSVGCSILITTRYRFFARLAMGENAECNISEMDPADARQLLLATCGFKQNGLAKSEAEAVDQLLGEFGYLALAIVLCGAYICHTNCNISQYREMYHVDPREMLHGDEINPLHIEGYELTIYKTWELSYAKLSPRSKQLMALVVFLRRDRISAEIFRRATANLPVYSPLIPPTEPQLAVHHKLRDILRMFTSQGIWVPPRFFSAMGELVSLSLVTFDPANNYYHIHPLVQQWARSISPEMVECTAALLAVSIDRGLSTESYAFRRGLTPHINEIVGFCPFMRPSSSSLEISRSTASRGEITRCSVIDPINIAWQYVESYSDADQVTQMEKLEKLVYQTCQQEFGDEHPKTLECMRYLAGTHSLKGDFQEAERLHLKVLNVRRQTLGEQHPDTLRSMSGLADAYYNQFRFPEAKLMLEQLLASWEHISGKDSPSSLKARGDLAVTYHALDRLNEAEALEAEVLAAQSAVIGKDHPETLQSMANLAVTYEKQGRLGHAEQLGIQVLELRKKALGDEHPDTQRSKANLAVVFYKQGRLSEAEELGAEVLKFRKQSLGVEHPETLQSMGDIAAIYNQQERFDEAEAIEAEVLATRSRLLGDEHLETLQTMANLAVLYHRQARFEEAENLGARVLSLRQKRQGDEHPDTLRSMINLATTYCLQGRLAEAEKHFAFVVEVRRRILGGKHGDTLSSMAHLAWALRGQGRLGECMALKSEIDELSAEL